MNMNRPLQKVRPKSNAWKVGFSMEKYSYKLKKKIDQDA